jgi:hypothetical protein
MVSVRKAVVDDFESVYSLLSGLNFPLITRDVCRRLFTSYWDKEEDNPGYVLVDRDRVVGFLGSIFSARFINNNVEKFCNLTTWAVKKEYRGESISLVDPFLKLKGYTLTVFTPAKVTCLVLEKLGFKEIDTALRIIPPLPVAGASGGRCSLELDKDRIRGYLDARDMKIYNDHIKFDCVYLLLKPPEGENCFAVIKKTRKKKLPFAHVHYISNPYIFSKYINTVSLKACLAMKVVGLIIDERYLKGRGIRYSIRRGIPDRKIFKSESLKGEDVDTLYSELFVLNL